MLRIQVKVSGINNLAEARYCAGMGVQYIGYNIDPVSDHALQPSAIKEIQGWLSGIEPVLELGKEGTLENGDWLSPHELLVEIPYDRIASFTESRIFVRLTDWNFDVLKTVPPAAMIITPELTEANAEKHLAQITAYSGHDIFISWRGNAKSLEAILQSHTIAGIELPGEGSQAGIFEAHDLADIIELLEEEN
jgi:phosphoribosylanthranilate isomerase